MSTQKIPVATDDSIEARHVGGDLRIKGWDQAELQARGDSVRIEKSEASIVVACGDDLELSIPQGARLVVSGIGGDVTIEDLSGSVQVGLTGGDATLRNLSGTVTLGGPIGGEMHTENVAHLSMKPGIGGADFGVGDLFHERVRQKVEHATRRAEAQIRKAERRAHRYAQFRSHAADGLHWTWDAAGTPGATSSSEPVSDDERMMILRMLQEKKITAEQAEKLLAALEGNG